MPTRVKSRPAAKKNQSGAPSRLREYRAKRNLEASGEPSGAKSPVETASLRYVIQKHDATRLHYDFRLEMEGVLRSWAVPKGLPKRPGEKSLAVEVEDHPLDYGTFEGTIPEGNYGAGTVMLWDRGSYSVKDGTPETAYRAGKIHFALDGEKCHGEWTLVRMKEREGEKKNWLLIKNSEAKRGSPFRAEGLDLSVKTGRDMDQIAGGTTKPLAKKKAARAAAKTPAARPAGRSAGTAAGTAEPRYVEPMKALGVDQIAGDEWLLEIKYDGFRVVSVINAGKVELWSRNEKSLTSHFPEVADGLSQLPCKNAVLDGEVVAVDADGRPAFQLLQGIGSGGTRPPIIYYVFDLLLLNGRSFLDQPIEERREALEEFLKRTPDCVRVSPVFAQRPEVLLDEVRRRGLEGIVGKRRGSRYESGLRSGAWVKHRVVHGQEFVIAGFTPPKGGRPHFGAILVGYYEGDELRYAGKVGAGFDGELLGELHEKFQALQGTCPFSRRPAGSKDVTWLQPKLVAQVKYSEWTRDGLLRQPVFLGLRDDKDPRDVVREAVGR